MRRRQLLALGVGLTVVGCSRSEPPSGGSAPSPSGNTSSSAPSPSGRLTLAVIPKGTTHEFWKSVHAGAVKASRELDVDIVWKGPLKEDDLKSQIDLVQSFTAQKVSALALAPLNDKALVSSVNAAAAGGTPVVIFDSALSGGKIVSFVATDNHAAGRLAAARAGELLADSGKIVVLRYQEGSAS